MASLKLIDQAKTFGENSANDYASEFGSTPQADGVDGVGDWDAPAWSGAWASLKDDGATDDDYAACLAAWREGFWI